MPVYNTPETYLDQAIWSVRNQLYGNWELCIADDKSSDSNVRKVLSRHGKEDDRIKIMYREENGHISLASNSALELASGQYVALLDHDDVLAEHALYMIVKELNENPGYKFIYTDEDKISPKGVRSDPTFKPDWNLDLFLSMNYPCHLSVLEISKLKEIGGFRVGYEGSQDYDLLLRYTETLEKTEIGHIPHVLYHWRMIPGSTATGTSEKDYCAEAGLNAISDYLMRNGISANAELIPGWGTIMRIKYDVPCPPPLVSIIILARNGLKLLSTCVDSINSKTSYSNYEIVIVANDGGEEDCIEYREKPGESRRVNVIRYEGAFNYAAICNYGVDNVNGDIVCLLNDDTEVIDAEWLTELVSHAVRPGVGAVGAKLLYEDNSIQHAGIVLGVGGTAGYVHRLLKNGMRGYFNRAGVIQNYTAVTGACMVLRKRLYKEIGGMDKDQFCITFNDVDFCLKLVQAGYRNVWTPFSFLYHYESKTREYGNTDEKIARLKVEEQKFREKWGQIIGRDPAYNPNLSLEKEDFSLSWPPRDQL